MTFKYAAPLFVIVSVLFLSGCDRQETPQREQGLFPPATHVTVAEIASQAAANQIEIVGTVQAVQAAKISSKITGNITTLTVDLGSRVTRGDLLVELSAEEISAQLQQARAHYEQAQRNLVREEKLLKKNAATLETVKSLRDSSRIAEAAYREAQTMLNYTRISAPFTGIVTRKLANVGDLATPTQPLLHLEDDKRLQVLTAIPEAMLLTIKKGDSLSVTVPSVDLIIEGTVAEMAPTVDASSRSAAVKLNIPFHPKLRSGQFARISLAKKQAGTLVIPASAVTTYGQLERVFVVDNTRARLRLVRTGARNDKQVEILSGLSPNDTVIVAGNEGLVDGQAIDMQ